jgi:lipoate-protein ligase A
MIIRYLKDEKGKMFGTVIIDGDNVGWSLCNPKDRFDKKLGKRIALNRLEKYKTNYLKSLDKHNNNHYHKHSIKVRRKDDIVEYPSRIDVVIDKVKYLTKSA